jgi:hypothetical protein
MTEDRDDAEHDALLWLKFEAGVDVDAELEALNRRRHEAAAREAAEFEAVVGPIKGEFITGTAVTYRGLPTLAQRLRATPLILFDCRAGEFSGGTLDYNRPPGAPPWS